MLSSITTDFLTPLRLEALVRCQIFLFKTFLPRVASSFKFQVLSVNTTGCLNSECFGPCHIISQKKDYISNLEEDIISLHADVLQMPYDLGNLEQNVVWL